MTRQAALGRTHLHLLDAGGMIVGGTVLVASQLWLAPLLGTLPFWESGPKGVANAKMIAFLIAALAIARATQVYVRTVRRRFGSRLPPPWGTDGGSLAPPKRIPVFGRLVLLAALVLLVTGFWMAFWTPFHGALGAALFATAGLLAAYIAAHRGDRLGLYLYGLVVLGAPALVLLPYGVLTSMAVSIILLGFSELLFAAVRAPRIRPEIVA